VASPFLFFFAGPSRTTDCPGPLRLRLQHTADALLEVTRSNSASTLSCRYSRLPLELWTPNRHSKSRRSAVRYNGNGLELCLAVPGPSIVVWETRNLFLVLNKVMSRITTSEQKGLGLHSFATLKISISQRRIHTVDCGLGHWRQRLKAPLQG